MDTAASPSFATLLRRHRLAAGLTQEQLAERASLSVRAVSDLERGLRTAPRRDTVDLLAEALALAAVERTALRAAVSRHRGPAAHPAVSSLPAEVTSLIGREGDEARAIQLLRWEGIRLLTLTGPGGVGKTRLAIRVAHSLAADFADGVTFVPLASITDPSLVLTNLATSLGISEQEGQSIEEALVARLRGQERLVVLDNFEHLLAAAPLLSRLLGTCPRVTVLVTSRASMHLQLEQEMEVPPLAAPAPWSLQSHRRTTRSPAVTLFVQRAQAVRPEFRLTDDNAPAVAEICHRLDGLPLAIELAAARIKLFPPQALLQQLAHPLMLLTGGGADQPVRLQTLRNTVDWSYSLLTGEEQTLFVRLSVFAGGCTFEAAAAVCNPNGEFDLLAGLASLVDKSLVRQHGGEEARFGMLETIRQYAAEKLIQRGERDLLRRGHAEYFDGLVEEADTQLLQAEQGRWLARLEREHDNLRAALTWSLEEGSELGMRVAASLWIFWEVRGHLSEGRHWLETVLTVPERAGDAALRARVLSGAGNLAWRQGNFPRAKELHERALCLRRERGDTSGMAGSLVNLGRVARRQGRDRQAQELFEESLRLYRELGNTHGTALVLNCLGLLLQQRGNLERARALYEDSLQLMRELGETRGMTIAFCNLADLAEQQGEYERAQGLYRETLHLGRELGEKTIIVEALIGLGTVAAHQQQYERALQLLGAADTIALSIGVSLEPLDLERIQTVSRVTGEALSAEARDSARIYGAAMSLEEAIEYGLDRHGVISSQAPGSFDAAGPQ